MVLIQELFDKLAQPDPSYPGYYYMDDTATKKALQVLQQDQKSIYGLPVIEYTESNYPNSQRYGGWIFYVPSSIKGQYGNIGTGDQVYPSTGKKTDSLYQWTRDVAAQNGADLQKDPLGLNYLSNQKGQGDVVQYKKLATAGLPTWYPQPGTPTGMSGASIIYENGRPKKVITGPFETDIVEVK